MVAGRELLLGSQTDWHGRATWRSRCYRDKQRIALMAVGPALGITSFPVSAFGATRSQTDANSAKQLRVSV
jgi:hypothetical protein